MTGPYVEGNRVYLDQPSGGRLQLAHLIEAGIPPNTWVRVETSLTGQRIHLDGPRFTWTPRASAAWNRCALDHTRRAVQRQQFHARMYARTN